MTQLPRAMNHVGMTVPDIYKALDWYVQVLGFTHVMGPRIISNSDRNDTRAAVIMGPRFRKAYQVQLMTANGVGVELFQYVEPKVQPYEPDLNMEYWRQGYWHLCYTDPDLDALTARIVATGGKQRTQIFDMVPGQPYRLVYCEDPFGNVIELCSHSHAEVWSNWPQPGMGWEIPVLRRDGTEGPMTPDFHASVRDGSRSALKG